MMKNDLPVQARHPRRTPFGSATSKGIIAVFLLAVGVFSWFLFRPTTEEMKGQWKEKAGFDPEIEFPARDPNETALRLERLIAPLGLEIAPKELLERARPTKQQRSRLASVRGELQNYVLELRQIDSAPALPTGDLAAFLGEIEPILREVSVLLQESPEPHWELDLNGGIKAKKLNFLGHLRLHELLMAKAAEEAARGEHEQCLEWLEASWTLSQSLAKDPRIIPQMIAMGESRSLLSVLRALPFPLPGWSERLQGEAFSSLTERALRLESWIFLRSYEQGHFEEERLLASYDPAYQFSLRRGILGLVAFTDRCLERLREEDLLIVDYGQVMDEEEERIPRWNYIARMFVPHYLDVVGKAARLELSSDLTHRALEMRALLRNGDEEAVAALLGEHPAVLEGTSWIYEVSADQIVIRANREVPSQADHPLPMEISLPRSAGFS